MGKEQQAAGDDHKVECLQASLPIEHNVLQLFEINLSRTLCTHSSLGSPENLQIQSIDAQGFIVATSSAGDCFMPAL